MVETSLSLLDALRNQGDAPAWQRLVDLYSPLIRGWLRRQGLADVDSDDVVQEVMTVVVKRVDGFQRNEQVGSFRAWLRSITVRKLQEHWRSRKSRPLATGHSDIQAMLDQLSDPNSGLSQEWNAAHDKHVAQQLLGMIQGEFQPKTWAAFQRFALDGLPADQVAAELEMSVNAVFIAKSRVLARLRQVGRGLLDDS
ncbi:MAG TPA: sigma-70 family RNA polymerase sigma factor [Pirellulaceae bacterium]|nr:sigma-70 family RNA polymerase sigma factor [Pirellulaceae bacterium]